MRSQDDNEWKCARCTVYTHEWMNEVTCSRQTGTRMRRWQRRWNWSKYPYNSVYVWVFYSLSFSLSESIVVITVRSLGIYQYLFRCLTNSWIGSPKLFLLLHLSNLFSCTFFYILFMISSMFDWKSNGKKITTHCRKMFYHNLYVLFS